MYIANLVLIFSYLNSSYTNLKQLLNVYRDYTFADGIYVFKNYSNNHLETLQYTQAA